MRHAPALIGNTEAGVTPIREIIGDRPAAQQPCWPDADHLGSVVAELEQRPPLVTPEVADRLTEKLGEVAAGNAFYLQGGPCAESFSDTPADTRKLVSAVLAMTVTLMYKTGVPVVKGLRAAGQYPKPRSSATETRDGVTLPAFRGEIINGSAFTDETRRPDPDRLLRAYDHAEATLETIRGLTKTGATDLERVHAWNMDFARSRTDGDVRERYEGVADEVSRALSFMKACGVDVPHLSSLHAADLYPTHEALLLDYECPLTRYSADGNLYGTSGAQLWIGERTRQTDGAHVAFAEAIQNPVAVKIGPLTTPEDILELCQRLNPKRVPGRLTLISRMGADKIDTALPPLVHAVEKSGYPVVWSCDPMHGNTITAPNDKKTRRFEDITRELTSFFGIFRQAGAWPGGMHLELTGDNVTECLGGSDPTAVRDLDHNYTTQCDPRLNGQQGLEVALTAADELAKF